MAGATTLAALVRGLRARRAVLGLSQEQVGERMGISGAAIGQYETCANMPSAPRLFRWIDALELDVRFFDKNGQAALERK